jgi:hypothetical protein
VGESPTHLAACAKQASLQCRLHTLLWLERVYLGNPVPYRLCSHPGGLEAVERPMIAMADGTASQHPRWSGVACTTATAV